MTMSGLIGFLLAVLVLLVIVYVAHLVLDALRLPEHVRKIATLIIALLALLFLLQQMGLLGGVWR